VLSLSDLRPIAGGWGLSMLEQAMLEQSTCRDRLLTAEALRNIQGNVAIPEPQTDVSRMAALICHDLRLPLSTILANAEFLTQSDISEAEKREFYQEIRWSIDRMNEMVSSLMEYSKNRDNLRPAARNIVYTIERAIRMTRARKEFRRITINYHHRGSAVGWFDSNRLEQVFVNLILNACEAVSADTGLVVVTTTGNKSCLQIGIWDNGPGIPPEIHDSVFQPFVSYGKAEGSGLGLAIVKKIVEDHGGEIYVDGRSGAGTLFKITIPFAIPLEAIPHISTVPIRPTRAKGNMTRGVHALMP
jgi:signal transduction histidine kinase